MRFIFPHATPRPVTINNGFVMRAWYDIKGFGPERAEDDEGIRESERVVKKYIEQQIAQGIAAERLLVTPAPFNSLLWRVVAIDGAHFADTAARLDPARTLVIVSSKTFTTLETMANARLARSS